MDCRCLPRTRSGWREVSKSGGEIISHSGHLDILINDTVTLCVRKSTNHHGWVLIYSLRSMPRTFHVHAWLPKDEETKVSSIVNVRLWGWNAIQSHEGTEMFFQDASPCHFYGGMSPAGLPQSMRRIDGIRVVYQSGRFSIVTQKRLSGVQCQYHAGAFG